MNTEEIAEKVAENNSFGRKTIGIDLGITEIVEAVLEEVDKQ